MTHTSGRSCWSGRIAHVVGAVVAVLAVTAASYAWRLAQSRGAPAVLAVYLVSGLVLAAGAFVVFRRVVRRDYELNGRLTPLPAFLQLLVWGLFLAYPCIYNPPDWAWSASNPSKAHPVAGTLGWACVGLGLLMATGTMAWLGLPRSLGQAGRKLESAGPYRLTRNPQLVCGVPLVLGYVILWPAWYALGWLALFAGMAHMMVLTEEEHLRRLYGEEYEAYCQKVPRYLWFTRRS